MKEMPLTQNQVAIVDDEDYEWLSEFKWYAQKHHGTFYAVCGQGKNRTSMHRLLTGEPEKPLVVDHINRNGIDNRKCNLRIVSHRQNNQNRKKRTSRFPGVYYHKQGRGKKRWRAVLYQNGERVRLGHYATEEEAFIAYMKASLERGLPNLPEYLRLFDDVYGEAAIPYE